MSADHILPKIESLSSNKQFEQSFNTICNLCSVGCTLRISHDNGEITEVNGLEGLINSDGVICDYPIEGYKAINKSNRITQPLLRKGSNLIPVSWEEAFNVIKEQISKGNPDEMAFFAGARLTNEEQYLIQKLSRACAYTNNIGSFHYLGRGTSYTKLSRANIPFAELIEARKIFIIGAEVLRDSPVAGYFIFNDQKEFSILVEVITDNTGSELIEKADSHIIVKSYFDFLKAVNFTIVNKGLEDSDYIKNLVENFEEYKQMLLALDFDELQEASGVNRETIEKFASSYRDEPHAVVVFSESELSGHVCAEIFNLAMLTGKHGRTGAGLLLIKENNNSHGLHDIGVMWNLGPGATPWDDEMQRSTVQFHWRSKNLPVGRGCTFNRMNDNGYKSLFIFGEDPIGCAINPDAIKEMLLKSEFIVVQDYTLTPTAELATLVLPASMPYESGGTFTNSQRVIQKANKRLESPLEYVSWKQLEELLAHFGYERFESVDDVTFEIASLLPKFCTSSKLLFRLNSEDNYNPLFKYGCDLMHRLVKS